jgi:hypothetical protein
MKTSVRLARFWLAYAGCWGDDFFGRGWVDAFLGPEAAMALGMRLDGAEFARVRVLAATLEPVSIG